MKGLKKISGAALSLILAASFAGMVLGRVPVLVFWAVAISCAAAAYLLPRL